MEHKGHAGHGEDCAGAQLDEALAVLKEAGHRITAPRRALLELLQREHGPFSADELHRRLPTGLCDPVTVYRCLGTLE